MKPYGILFCQEAVQILLQLGQFFFGAVADDPKGMGEIQTEQLHKGVCVDLVEIVPDGDGEAAGGGQGHKVLHILDASQSDKKFLHKMAPLLLYKVSFFVYNGEQAVENRPISRKTMIENIISVFCEKATVALDD